MGQNSSTASNAADAKEKIKYQEFVKNYQFLRKIKDPRYGEISVLQDKFTKELVALREILSKSTKDFERDMANLRMRYKISHPNIIKVLGYTSKSEENLCSSVHKILMIVEYLDNDLEKEIAVKKNQNNYYKEEQLWYLIENVVKALAILQKNDMVHEDLKPNSIFISKMGVYKITQHNIASNTIPAYHQRLTGMSDGRTYLSPSLLANLQKYELRPKHDPWKSDVFSLGMTVLHAATLNSCDRLYDWASNSIDYEELGERLASLRPRYSERLQDFVQTMLEVRESARPDFLALEAKLQTATEPTDRLSAGAGHSPPKVRGQNDLLDEEGLDTSTIKPSNARAKMPVQEFNRNNINYQPSINNSLLGREDSRIASLTSVEKPLGQNYPGLARGQNNLGFDNRSPKGWNDVRVNEPAARVFAAPVDSQQGRYNAEMSRVVNQKGGSGRDLMAKGKGFSFPQQNDSEHELNGSTQITDFPPSMNALSNIAKNEGRTIPNSINEIFVANADQEQQIAGQYQSTGESDGQGGRRKTISNEVAKIISDFRTRMGLPEGQGHSNYASAGHEDVHSTQQQSLRQANLPPTASKTGGYAGQSSPQGFVSSVSRTGGFEAASNQQSNLMGARQSQLNTSMQGNRSPYGAENRTNYGAANYNSAGAQRGGFTQSSNVDQSMYSNYGQQQNQQLYNSAGARNSSLQQMRQPVFESSRNEAANYSSAGHSHTYDQQSSYEPSRRNEPQGYSSQQRGYQGQGDRFQQKPSDSLNQSYLYNQNQEGRSTSPYAQNNFDPQHLIAKASQMPYEMDARPQAAARKPFTSSNARVMKESEPVSETYADGSVYEGQKMNGLRHGKGAFYYSDGGMYTGDWVEGSMDGFGRLFYAGGAKAYEGQWKDDKFHGRGTVYNETPAKLMGAFDYTNFDNVGDFWVKYEGDFFNDNKEGNGALWLSNGERFQGQFREDMVEGAGVFYTLSGKVARGEWWQNKMMRP